MKALPDTEIDMVEAWHQDLGRVTLFTIPEDMEESILENYPHDETVLEAPGAWAVPTHFFDEDFMANVGAIAFIPIELVEYLPFNEMAKVGYG